MAYTSHGHHIAGTPANNPPKTRARCGGPGICPQCSKEAGNRNTGQALVSINEEDSLVQHVRRELQAWKQEDPKSVESFMYIAQIFSDMGHSGASAAASISILARLLSFQNVGPLTDDPDEWFHHGVDDFPRGGIWQNIRNSQAFSYDQGKTYYLLDERKDGIISQWHKSASAKDGA